MEKRLPAALWVTLLGGVLVSIGWWSLMRAQSDYRAMRVYGSMSLAAGGAFSAMLVAAMLATREVTTRPGLRTALSIAVIAYAVVEATRFAVYVWLDTDATRVAGLSIHTLEVLAWAGQAVRIAVLATLAAIGVRLARPMTIAGLALVLAAAALREAIPALFGIHGWSTGLGLGLAAATAAGTIALARLGVAGAGVGWRPAQGGLDRAASALAWRIGLGVSLVPLVFIAVELRSMGLLELIVIGVPLASAAAGAVSVIGLLAASRADAAGAPRVRLAVAAYTAAIGAAFDLIVGITIWRGLGSDELGELAGRGGTVGYVMPAIALLGTLAFVSALDAITARVSTGIARDRLLLVGGALTVVGGGGVWLQHAIGGALSPPTLVVISLVISVIAILTTLSLVSMTRQIAAALGGAPAVPAAIAREVS